MKFALIAVLIVAAVFSLTVAANAAKTDATRYVERCKVIVENSVRFDSVGDCVSWYRSGSRRAGWCQDWWDHPSVQRRWGFKNVGDCVSFFRANGGNK